MSGPAPVSGGTHTVGIVGWPVARSLSPAIHNAAFAALELDWTYVPLAVPPGEEPAAFAGLHALGFAGANVTMPHKDAAARASASLSEDAARLGAVNTLVADPAGLRGHNTDAPGFERFLRDDAAFDPAGVDALVIGAGGAARACALALARGGVARVRVAVRDPARAGRLAAALEGSPAALEVVELGAPTGPVDLIVNATPVDPPLGDDLVRARLVVDLRTDPPETQLERTARAAGIAAFGGLGLLLHQAALSFELWTGRPAPLEVMSAAALAAVAARR